jgi:phosphoribosylaminoimidazole-succinocarboxamide synthase
VGTPAERLNKLLKEDVLPNACSVDTDVFRERIAGDRVKDVFANHKFNLKKIYQEVSQRAKRMYRREYEHHHYPLK